jgi:3-oxoacyl-[acyl-carrier protein] reductase
MEPNLKDNVAFVAGSSRGIGRAIAHSLLRRGCRTCISGRQSAPLEQTLSEFRREFGEAQVVAFSGDMTAEKDIHAALQAVPSAWGCLNALVVNIGSGKAKIGWDLTEDDWRQSFEINFWGAIRLAQAAIPLLAPESSITFIASIAGVERTPAPLPYSAAKAALINYAKNLSGVLAPRSIRVNTVAPGNILFPGGSWEGHLRSRPEEVTAYIKSEVPSQRFGTPEEVGEVVAFLSSPQAAFITGACFIVDGGQTRSL